MTLFAIFLAAELLSVEERASFEEAIAHHLALRMEDALNGYERVLSSHPGFLPARLYRSEALFLVNRRSEAREDLELARSGGSDLLLFRMLERILGVSAGEEPRDGDARKAIGLYEELKRKKRGVLSQEEVLALR